MTDASRPPIRRAIVLGGGGVAGIAWHLGVLKELLAAGIPLQDADLVVGTSAGSVAGTILRFGQVDAVYAAQVREEDTSLESAGSTDSLDIANFQQLLGQAIAGFTSPQDARARLGAAAVRFSRGAESPLLTTLGAQFPTAHGWPPAALGVCVVDAVSGAFRVIDAGDGIELSRAVAASCSVPLVFPPVDIDGTPFVDGGVRSATNADVAAGYDRVLVLSCGPEDSQSPMGPQIDEAVTALEAGTAADPSDGADLGSVTGTAPHPSDVFVVMADEASIRAFGSNSLAVASRVPSAEAGRTQALAAVDAVRAFWG